MHQFAPGGHAVHNNDNLTDAEAEWYLARYPHIRKLFNEIPQAIPATKKEAVKASGKRKRISITASKICDIQHYENLPAAN